MGASGLGALLVKEGFLTEQDRVTITKTCGQGSWAFAKCILSTGLLDEDELSAFFAERTKYVVAPKNLLERLDPGIIEQVDRRMVSRLEVLPLEIDHHRITVAVADPLDKSTLKQLEFFTGLEVVPVIAPLSQIYEGLNRLNPEFKARPTALSNFLRNHAGAAWIKQKIVEEGDVEIPQDRRSARAGALDNYDEDQVEDVALDDEIDAMDDSSDNLNDIAAGGLDEGIGNSDFDDIDLEDDGSDLELAPGDDPDRSLGEAIDDGGMSDDDPFDNFEEAPKARKAVAAAADDDLDGLEAGGDSTDDLWPDLDDAPAKPKAAAPKPKPADDELSAGDDLSDDFGLDDEPAKPAKKATAISDELSDFGLDDEPAKPAKKATAISDELSAFGLDDDDKPAKASMSSDEELSDDFGLDNDDKPAKKAAASSDDLADDFELDDEPKKAPQKKAKAAADVDDDLLGETPDLSLDDEKPEPLGADDQELGDLNFGDEDKAVDDEIGIEKSDESGELAEDLNFGAEASDEDIDSLLDEPAPASSHAGKNLLGFGDGPSKPHYESTRMAQKPDLESKPDELDDDLSALEFADDDDETSVSLRKAVHEDGVVPEFNDPNFDGEAEDTRIDLHAPVEDDLQFEDDEETNIKLHPAPEKKPGKSEPTFHKGDDDPLEGLAMGFDNDDVIDEPSIGDLAADADLDDIPIEAPAAPARAGGRTTPSLVDNGSLASLTATAKANEALLRMSLCFDRSTALEIAREYLPQISATGCLVDIGKTTETLATWRSGAESAAKGKAAAFQRMAKAAKSGQWSEIPVQAQDDLFGSVKTVSVYKIQKDDGRILLLVGDYPVEDESLREALTSFAEQLGSK